MMLSMGQQGFPQAEFDAALARLRRTWQRMEETIEQSGGPWLLGETITLADVAAMPALVRMDDLGLGAWQDLPNVTAWFAKIRSHPAFAPTYYPGSLLSERFPHLRERSTSRLTAG
jgi:glutathione S-transferase